VKIATVETIPVSVPYRHREISSQVARDGVSDVLVKLTTDDGLVGWGEACCGADTASVEAALRAMTPFVVGRDPWNREAMRRDVFTHGLWQFQSGTGNFAWAGIDMALWDVCGRACGQPIWRLLGGLQQQEATYFYYLARDTEESLRAQVDDGLETGIEDFYLKVGLDDAEDIAMVATVRDALGPGPLLRIDANGSWTIPQAVRNLRAMDEYDIDFVEQPVRDHPIGQLAELRARTNTRRELGEMPVPDPEFVKPRRQSPRVREGVVSAAYAPTCPHIAEQVHASLKERAEELIRRESVNTDGDDLLDHRPLIQAAR
jgi:L-alanine-DL-glutamate epimerase-like enolase superfamily enzyme